MAAPLLVLFWGSYLLFSLFIAGTFFKRKRREPVNTHTSVQPQSGLMSSYTTTNQPTHCHSTPYSHEPAPPPSYTPADQPAQPYVAPYNIPYSPGPSIAATDAATTSSDVMSPPSFEIVQPSALPLCSLIRERQFN